MAWQDPFVNGFVTLGVLVASIWIYLYLEKRKYMLTKKIEVYSALTSELKKWFIALPNGGLDKQKRNEKQIQLEKE